jgi:nitrogen-specific signal transduction histidine kinase/ActR/RegA family two-component response regulator
MDGSIHFTGIIHDQTATKQTEMALQRAHKMEAIGQLTGGIAHDFNNLLTVVTGNLELMEMRLDDAYLLSLLREAQEASDLGAKLTERLLAFARRSPLEPEVIDLNTLVVSLTDLLHRTLGEQVELGAAISPDLWPVLADRGQLESAVINLAVNARDAMPNGGRLFIETANAPLDAIVDENTHDLGAGDYVRLSISDDGAGIKPEHLERVFEPFFTTKEVGRGTGLGLSMVYGFAKQSKGHATIYSEVGTGTTVNLYLPRHRAAGAAVQSVGGRDPMARGNGECVLVVEDDSKVRALTVKRLEALGYSVEAAENGPKALAMLPDLPDLALLLTDLVMPGGMSGYELVEAALSGRPGLPVLLTSGYAEDLFRSEHLAERKIKLLRKPYRQIELAAAIRQALVSAQV